VNEGEAIGTTDWDVVHNQVSASVGWKGLCLLALKLTERWVLVL